MSPGPNISWNFKWAWLILVCLCAGPRFAAAKDTGVEARLTSAKLIEVTPGKIVTASIVVANWAEHDEEFFERVVLPEGWRKVTPQDAPFTAGPRGEEIRLVALAVPATAASGRFEIAYTVQSRRDYASMDTATFSVVVRSVSKLELLIEEKPQFAVAGDSYQARLRLINRGNNEATINLAIKGPAQSKVTLEATAVTLAAGASRPIRLNAATEPGLRAKASQIVVIQASTGADSNSQPVQVNQTLVVDVLPRISGDSDPYVRLPVTWRVSAAGETGRDFGAQTEVSGAGNLDESGDHKIDFLFRGPDLQENSTFGLRDEYRLSLYDKGFDLHAGDRTYTLSPLTERYGYGRGVEFDLHPGPTAAGLYYMESRWRQDNFNEVGAYARHQFNETFSLKANVLDKNGRSFFLTNGVSANVYSLQPHLHLGKELDLDLEYGISDSALGFGGGTDAYRAEARGQLYDRFNYSLERVHADPKFLGYYNDSDATYGSLTFPIREKLRGSFSVNQYENNLSLDPRRGTTATRELSFRPGILYTLPFRTDLTLEYQNIRREDALQPAAFDFQEHSARVGLGRTFFNKLTLQTFVEQGVMDDYVTGRNRSVERYSVYASFRATPSQTYSLFTTLGTGRFNSAADWQESYGAAAQWKIKETTTINVQYARNQYNSFLDRQQNSAFATVSHTFVNRHNVALTGRWIQTSGARDETSVLFTYSVPLSVPIAKKTSVGVIKGKVYDAEKGRSFPLARVILRANDITAVTDKSGQFIFPSLKPGTYVLQVEPNSVGMERVTAEPFPVKVEVKKGTSTTIDVGVVHGASLTVTLARMAAPAGHRLTDDAAAPGSATAPSAALQQVGGFESGLVELSNGREVIRQITDRLGVARFERLRPGAWTLSVYDNNLPEFHYVESPKSKVELNAGDAKKLTVRIMPKERQIQFIDQGTVK